VILAWIASLICRDVCRATLVLTICAVVAWLQIVKLDISTSPVRRSVRIPDLFLEFLGG
jgi:hypothetical protein